MSDDAALTGPRRVALLLCDTTPEFIAALDAWFEPLRLDIPTALHRAATGGCADVRIVITNAARGVPSSLIEALPALSLILSLGIGTDRIDASVARARGITVANTPVDSGDSVADLAMALMLGLWRSVSAADGIVRKGAWLEQRLPLGRTLRGEVCGIAGLGRIGRAVADRAAAFGMEIAYWGPRAKPQVSWRYHPDLCALAAAADILVLTMPALPDTVGIVDASILDALGPRGVLVNVARGQLVDEPALIRALQERRIAGAGLDVFATEPVDPGLFASLDNVLLTPHIGAATEENFANIFAAGLAVVEAFAVKDRTSRPVS